MNAESTPQPTHRPLRPKLGEPLAQILRDHPVIEVEIGTGKGLFLQAAAKQSPQTYFVGVEIAQKYAAMAQKKMESQQLTNVRVFCGDGVSVISDEIPENRLHAVHVYFPDPWWKARHKKRRVLNERMLIGIERALIPGGFLHFWTDVIDYYQSTLELIQQVTRLQGPLFVDEPPALHDLDYRTHFERRTRLNGLPVYRSQFQKLAQA